MACLLDYILLPVRYHLDIGRPAWLPIVDKRIVSWAACRLCTLRFVLAFEFEIEHMDISSFPCTQLLSAFSLGWTQETDVRVTASSLLKSSGKPEEVFPTNIFSVLNECPPLSTEPIYSANKSSKVTTLMKSLLYSLWVRPYVVISVLCIAAFRGICSRILRMRWEIPNVACPAMAVRQERQPAFCLCRCSEGAYSA